MNTQERLKQYQEKINHLTIKLNDESLQEDEKRFGVIGSLINNINFQIKGYQQALEDVFGGWESGDTCFAIATYSNSYTINEMIFLGTNTKGKPILLESAYYFEFTDLFHTWNEAQAELERRKGENG